MNITIKRSRKIGADGRSTINYLCTIDGTGPKFICGRYEVVEFVLNILGMEGVTIIANSEHESTSTVVWGEYQMDGVTIDGHDPLDIFKFCEKVLENAKMWMANCQAETEAMRRFALLFDASKTCLYMPF